MDYNNNHHKKRLKTNNFSGNKFSLCGPYNECNDINSNMNTNDNDKYHNYRNSHYEMSQEKYNHFPSERANSRKKNNKFSILQKQIAMNKNTHVDNTSLSRLFIIYPKEATEDEIYNAFKIFGHIMNISVIKDQNTQIEKGIVYIQYSKASEALKAMEEMNGKYIENYNHKALRVLLSQDGNKNFNTNEPFTARLYVKIDKTMNRFDLKNMFKKYGDIKGSYITMDRETNESKGFGFVTFNKSSDAARALEECDPSFNAKFSFANSNRNSEKSSFFNKKEAETSYEFNNSTENSHSNSMLQNNASDTSGLPPTDNFDHLVFQNQNKEKENIIKYLTENISQFMAQNYDMNNNAFMNQNLNHENSNKTNEKIIQQSEIEQLVITKSPDRDERIVKKQNEPKPSQVAEDIISKNQTIYAFDETLGSDFVLKVRSKLNVNFLKSLFNLILGMKFFKTITIQSSPDQNGEYLAKYSNDLMTFHAMQKLSQMKFPGGDTIDIKYIREIDSPDIIKTQVLVLINCERDLTVELLHLIMNQFKGLLNCGVHRDKKSGYAVYSNKADAVLAVNCINNREIALNFFQAHIETEIENYLCKTN